MAATPGVARQWQLKHAPQGHEEIKDLFELKEVPLYNPEDLPEGEGGQKASNRVLVKTRFISNDPTQRGWMNSNNPRAYMKPVQPGEPMRAWAVGEVIESFSPSFTKGDLVFGFLNWTTYTLWNDPSTEWPRGLMKLPPGVSGPDYLAMGVTALTAYFGLYHSGSASPSDKTIVVSGAAGATGSAVIQLAKNVLGCPNVIGIAGTPEKCAIVKSLGADHALDYKSPTFAADFTKAVGPGWIDIYFDNVGGTILDLSLKHMNKKGRIVACGAISTYKDILSNSGGGGVSAAGWINIVTQSLTVKGFILNDFNEHMKEGREKLYKWFSEGKIKPLKTVWQAKFEDVPEGLAKLFKGDNTGKMVTEIVD